MSCWRGICRCLRPGRCKELDSTCVSLPSAGWEAVLSSPLTQHRVHAKLSASQAAESFCPCCRRPLDLRLVGPEDAGAGACGDVGLPFAYVSLLFGNSAASAGYALGALALGQSLRASGTQHDLVLLHTSDVPEQFLGALHQSGLWRIREVEYLHGCRMLGNMRIWEGVFTKLRLFSMTEYQRVLFLDLDMLVLQNIDKLFSLRPPAAMQKGMWQPAHGAPLNGRDFFPTESWNEPHGGINAGVMLFEPDARVHAQMEREVADEWHPEHIYSYGPEQEYLSRFFADRWTHIDARYNFQLFRLNPRRPLRQLAMALGSLGLANASASTLDVLGAVQFSSFPKPWVVASAGRQEVLARLKQALRSGGDAPSDGPSGQAPPTTGGAAEGGEDTAQHIGLVQEILARWRAALDAALDPLPPAARHAVLAGMSPPSQAGGPCEHPSPSAAAVADGFEISCP
mmetsp:Transcript_45401/g.135732  ORF Transcript_45401/g.135732 Transcript_45401/m.135732 type:complete len:456 (-) Transcript_45401:1217-2584(-)